MRKMFATALALLLVTATVAHGQQIGDTPPTDLTKVATGAAVFLKLPVGAKALSLGGGGMAVLEDVSALYWNPAGIAKLDRTTVGYNRADLYAGITHTFAGLVLPLGLNSRLGISYIGLDSGDMLVTTVQNPEGSGDFFNVTNTAIGLTFSQVLTDRFTLGITGKWVQEKIQRSIANAFALDIGSSFNTGLLGTRIGMAIQNIGPAMQMSGPDLKFEWDPSSDTDFDMTAGMEPDARLDTFEYDLPLMFRMGVAVDVLGGISTLVVNDMNRVTAMMDIEDAADMSARVGVSLEYAWNETVFARFGYRLRGKLSDQLGERLAGRYRETFELAYGLGVLTTYSGYIIQLDYGIANYGDLGSVNQMFFSLGF
jgi:hypothetical protein